MIKLVFYLSIISFKPNALIKFAKSNKTKLESIEDIELLRALEIGLNIKTIRFAVKVYSVPRLHKTSKTNGGKRFGASRNVAKYWDT